LERESKPARDCYLRRASGQNPARLERSTTRSSPRHVGIRTLGFALRRGLRWARLSRPRPRARAGRGSPDPAREPDRQVSVIRAELRNRARLARVSARAGRGSPTPPESPTVRSPSFVLSCEIARAGCGSPRAWRESPRARGARVSARAGRGSPTPPESPTVRSPSFVLSCEIARAGGGSPRAWRGSSRARGASLRARWARVSDPAREPDRPVSVIRAELRNRALAVGLHARAWRESPRVRWARVSDPAREPDRQVSVIRAELRNRKVRSRQEKQRLQTAPMLGETRVPPHECPAARTTRQ
jgi:hypothetical protein